MDGANLLPPFKKKTRDGTGIFFLDTRFGTVTIAPCCQDYLRLG
jgi:hypothetical protein